MSSDEIGRTNAMSSDEIGKIKARRYECFIEDHEPKTWSEGQCAGYAGAGSLRLHLYRCKRKAGHGVGKLFCCQHAADFENRREGLK
jgi:hypothetical protein